MTENCYICKTIVDGIKKPIIHVRNKDLDVMALCESCHNHVAIHHKIPSTRSWYDYIKYDVIWG